VIQIDGQLVRPDAAQSYLDFSLIKDRLYRVNRGAETGQECNQLLVAHYNPMTGHMGYENTLDWIITLFYWSVNW